MCLCYNCTRMRNCVCVHVLHNWYLLLAAHAFECGNMFAELINANVTNGAHSVWRVRVLSNYLALGGCAAHVRFSGPAQALSCAAVPILKDCQNQNSVGDRWNVWFVCARMWHLIPSQFDYARGIHTLSQLFRIPAVAPPSFAL